MDSKRQAMTKITLGGQPISTSGFLPEIGKRLPDFILTKDDLTPLSLEDLRGKRVIFNIFPSVDTGVCASSSRRFNKEASMLDNTLVVCVSRDLPFAQKRFCAAEGLDNVVMVSDFRDGRFGENMGLTIVEGAFEGLHSRVVIVTDEEGVVTYTEQVPEIGQEPDYKSALDILL